MRNTVLRTESVPKGVRGSKRAVGCWYAIRIVCGATTPGKEGTNEPVFLKVRRPEAHPRRHEQFLARLDVGGVGLRDWEIFEKVRHSGVAEDLSTVKISVQRRLRLLTFTGWDMRGL